MKVIAINGSPRKDGNTAVLLRRALEGSGAADGKLLNLYDLDFRGCTSCFACKRKGSRCGGLCAMRDGLTDALREILSSDILLLGSPIYFADVTGEMRSFLERLLFPVLSYNEGNRSTFQGSIASAFLYTMNVPEELANKLYGESIFSRNQYLLSLLNGPSEVLTACDTLQFTDYTLFDAGKFDAAHKAAVRLERFPQDCRRAFELGKRLAEGMESAK